MKTIWDELATINCGPKLVNQFKLHEFIPNKWFDWSSSDKAKVIIVGQDWGPYVFLKKYVDKYKIESKKDSFDYNKFLFATFSSRTEKMLLQFLQKSFKEKFGREMTTDDWQPFFFTLADFFCRSGTLFRGSSNFDTKGVEQSLPFLKRQIEIIKPKIVLTLGDMALKQVVQAMNMQITYTNLTEFIKETEKKKYISFQGTMIIPSFHPAAHVNPNIIYERLAMVWQLFCEIRS